MTPARFLEQGELDFAEIVVALDEARRGLGDRFTDEVERALHGLSEYPLSGPAINRRARKKRLHSLPYNISTSFMKTRFSCSGSSTIDAVRVRSAGGCARSAG